MILLCEKVIDICSYCIFLDHQSNIDSHMESADSDK